MSNKLGIKNRKRTRRPSISYNPPRSPQSAFIHSTRIPCSQRGRGRRVPEYHSTLWTEGDHFDGHEPRARYNRSIHSLVCFACAFRFPQAVFLQTLRSTLRSRCSGADRDRKSVVRERV